MNLTVELSPELEERLRQEAEKKGVTAERYARMLLEDQLAATRPGGRDEIGSSGSMMTEERRRAFHAFVESFRDIKAPPIPLEALRRENLYDDRGR